MIEADQLTQRPVRREPRANPFERGAELGTAVGDLTAFMMTYKFGLDEVLTKIGILREEFTFTQDFNPIEHVKSRLKSPASIAEKALRKGYGPEPASIREHLLDIAGVRITCSFISDVYSVADMLTRQPDVKVLRTRDYIRQPKPNGYQSLHLILEIPVFLSDRVELVPVEVQIRTAAMDFWAGLEHKIHYKYRGDIPAGLVEELQEAATVAGNLDKKMERLRGELGQR
ncbi:GTP pyrophosphokinase family protein [Actinoplanes sp. NPDC048967]|uniref:GTP pyrophosphokinase n=1 Tax=Actinoplanes sp. NPDC048967 TaxID=3155269 RepID=UPI0033D6C83C